MRNNNLYTFLLISFSIILTSCGSSYTINGSTDLSIEDGHKFYLRTFVNDDIQAIDSCDIVHGDFHFSGSTDSIKLAFITTENLILPVILEEGEIKASINKTGFVVSGTDLNDKFYEFRKQVEKIEGEYMDLENKQLQGIKNGLNEDSLNVALTQEARIIISKRENYIKNYIKENLGNPLSVAAFEYITFLEMLQGGVPQLTPMIDEILSRADDNFKNDPYVKAYIKEAKVVEGVMNGTIEQPGQANQQDQQALPTDNQAATPQQEEQANQGGDADQLKELEGTIPTPNQLAEPANKKNKK